MPDFLHDPRLLLALAWGGLLYLIGRMRKPTAREVAGFLDGKPRTATVTTDCEVRIRYELDGDEAIVVPIFPKDAKRIARAVLDLPREEP